MLLLFALVLGLSAVVASLAPPPERDAERIERPALKAPAAGPQEVSRTESVRFEAPEPEARRFETRTRAVTLDSSLSVDVEVPGPGEVVLDGLGLRQPADPLSPAHFDLLARPEGRYAVVFFPVSGDAKLVGRLEFVRGAAARRRAGRS